MNALHGQSTHETQSPQRHRESPIVRSKKVDLASSLGAGVIGGGIGVLAAPYVDHGPIAIALIAVGIVLHAWGMLERRRLETSAPRVWWAEALYWLCWGILAVIAIVALASR